MSALRRQSFPFLGNRDYLHGTTLFRALTALVPQSAHVSFKFIQRIDSDTVQITTDSDAATADARLSWRDGKCAGLLSVSALPQSKSPIRLAFDEEIVLAAAHFSDCATTLAEPSPFDYVATVVPLFKGLLLRVAPQQEKGQWFFARLDSVANPRWPAKVSVSLERIVDGRWAKAGIETNAGDFAELYFSWVCRDGA